MLRLAFLIGGQKPCVIQPGIPSAKVHMPDDQEILRHSIFTDLTVLRDNLDKTWAIVQSLPIGRARSNLELIHQGSMQLKKTLMELMYSR
jgi:hypothetical protein